MADIQSVFMFSRLFLFEVKACLQYYERYKDNPLAGKNFVDFSKQFSLPRLARDLMRGYLDVPREKTFRKIAASDFKAAQIRNRFKGILVETQSYEGEKPVFPY